MEPIVKKRSVKRLGYVDDIVSLYVVGDIYTAYEKLREDYWELLGLSETEGSPFNPKKIEV